MKSSDLKKLENIEVDGIHTWDYPDFCDAYISEASWKDTGRDLTQEELDDLNDNHGEFVHEQVWNHLY